MTAISAFGPITASMTSAALKTALNADGTTRGPVGLLADNSVEQQFLKYAQMSPMDRLRANILKSMGLTEDDLNNMSPDQQRAVEQKIKDLITQELEKNADKKGQFVDVSA
ncbi:hypothetical protein [Bradyrhizobium lablabi]|uniref:hypothetical protein n=1 Tax=Bradyrhizobium lablabi TaxID=722472 RepID=UPI001BA62623|nr:hypothetical protein [Bradyrhizobium lablabi]MBR0696251.1 hypothetical protein [Bradyrhizobium lablabi]